MKKKILGGIVVVAIAAVAAWNVSLNSQSNDLSDISLANVEALADYEVPEVVITCSATYQECYSVASNFSGKCWRATSDVIGNCCYFTGRTSDYCCSVFC
jgi:hypothetical protein